MAALENAGYFRRFESIIHQKNKSTFPTAKLQNSVIKPLVPSLLFVFVSEKSVAKDMQKEYLRLGYPKIKTKMAESPVLGMRL